MATLKIESFEGGITDDYIDGPLNSAERMNNILINRYRKAEQRPGITIYDAAAPQIPPGNQQIDSIFFFDETVFAKSGTKLYYLESGGSWTTLAGPTGNDAFADSMLGAKASWSVWRGHVIITPGPTPTSTGGFRTVKVYRNSAGTWTLVQAGLPRAGDVDGNFDDNRGDATIGGLITSYTYTVGGINYRFIQYAVFSRTYTAKVNGIDTEFLDLSTPGIRSESGSSGTGTFGTRDYVNASGENYDTAGMMVRLYRTKRNGTIPYLETEVALGAAITSNIDDDDGLVDELYAGVTDGNFNDRPPKSYFSTMVGPYGWYAGGVDVASNELHTNRAWQSKPSDIDGVPSGNFVDFDVDTLSAYNSAGPHPMAFSTDKCFRVEGVFDSSGGGGVRPVLVSAVEGSVSQEMAKTTQGLYFLSENGFCYTNGFQAINLSKHLRKTYKDLPNKYRGSVAYDGNNKRVYFAVEWPFVDTVTDKNNAIFVLDEEWIAGERGCFTTITSDVDLQPTCLFFDSENQRLLIGDKRGYVFVFDDDVTTDPVVDTGAIYTNWNNKGIVPDYISTAWSFGSIISTKWVTKIYLIFKNLTGRLSVDLFSYNDDKDSPKQLKDIRERTTATSGVHSIVRWFKRQALRCTYKQVQLKKGFVTLLASDDYGSATLDGGANTAQLAIPWPTDDGESLVGHTLYIADDDYSVGWVISAHSGDTLTLLDPLSTLPSGVKEWIIKGYPKTEKFELHGFSVEYDVIDNTFAPYRTGGDGNNQ